MKVAIGEQKPVHPKTAPGKESMSAKSNQSTQTVSAANNLLNLYKPVGIQAITAASLCKKGVAATGK